MINILLTTRGDSFVKLKVFGHSMYDISGRDIVCAAVSTLSQSLILGLKEVISDDFVFFVDEKNSSVDLDISRYDEDNKSKAQVLFKTFKITMDKLILEYGQYINMKIKEE